MIVSISDSGVHIVPTPDPLHRPADRLSIRLLDWNLIDIDRAWNSADVCSTYWRLYVNNRDGACVLLDTETYAITPGAIHFIPAWTRFSCRCDRAVSHFYVHFDTVGLPGAVIRDSFSRPHALPAEPELDKLLDRLRHRDAHHHLELQLMVKSAVYAALARLFATLPRQAADRLGLIARGDHPVHAALNHIEAHLAETITNRDLAALCHCSEDHFIRRRREIVGQSPAQYIIERRVGRAAQLLLFSDLSIEQIAEQAGFANRFYFSRVFSQRLGVPPALYRQAIRV